MPPPFHRLSVTILPVQVIIIFFAAKICSWYEPVSVICSNNTYTSSSSYGASLHRLLAQLIATVPDSPNISLYGSAKTGTQPSDVYALAQCRPDYLPFVCSVCLNKSVTAITASPANGGCGGSNSGALRLDECLIIYSDDPHLDFPEFGVTIISYSGPSSDSLEAARQLKALLTRNALDASTAISRFAVNAGYTAGLNEKAIYVMAWCRLDQFAGDCSYCLQIAIHSLLLNMSGCQVVQRSCIVRFEPFPFFQTTVSLSSRSPEAGFESESEVSASLGEEAWSKLFPRESLNVRLSSRPSAMPPPFHRLSVTILPLQVILVFFAAKICSVYEPVFVICSNNTYTSSSSYGASLHRLLAQLIVTVPDSPYLSLFGSAKTSTQPSDVYALAQCRPDYPPIICSGCLNQSVTVTTASPFNGGCGGSLSVALRLDECLLIYSDDPYLDFPEFRVPIARFRGPSSDSLDSAHRLKALLTQNALDASTASSRFAGNAGYTAGLNEDAIYVMAWCRLDQLAGNCSYCLHLAIHSLLLNMSGGLVVERSCIVRFEPFPFFQSTISLTSRSPEVFKSEGEVSASLGEGKGHKIYRTLFISISGTVAFVVVCIIFIVIRSSGKKIMLFHIKEDENKEQISIDQCLHHELGNIRAATSDFSEENKLGVGGFGSVYRGVLRDGQEIAVKRLSKTSVQGVEELKNEVAFVAKLQHRNLVRLVGCCLEKEEKLLLYEYLPNKSLDKFLFDPERRARLDWGTRYKIIEGVAQGLLYLHEDSRLRVIHCDLKASNVLLDHNMNPKISDFGLAKLFGLNDVQRKTSRIAGTQGYMAPEYAMRGLFSTKSDVYSYGVLVLEMITGRRGVYVDESADSLDLQSYVGEKWKEGNPLRAVDRSLGDRFLPDQMLRCIQIGLLCIQEDPAQRPSMASLVVMLCSGDVLLPEPLLPAFLR